MKPGYNAGDLAGPRDPLTIVDIVNIGGWILITSPLWILGILGVLKLAGVI